MLIERGANVTDKDMSGYTPLHYACSSGLKDAAHMLIERGANVIDKIDGKTWHMKKVKWSYSKC